MDDGESAERDKQSQQNPASQPRKVAVEELIQLALAGLPQMYHHDHKVFCYSAVLKGNALVKRGISTTNTLITLIGIRRAEIAGYRAPIETEDALGLLRRSVLGFDKVGNVGLYLWLLSMSGAETIECECSRIERSLALGRYRDARQGRTMEMSWLLSGLSELALAGKGSGWLADLALEVFRIVESNQESSGLFRHMSATDSLAGRLRSRVGSFADQIYPIHALSRFSLAFGIEQGNRSAISCAETICDLQGQLGQWWWHYDCVGGKVIGEYPVYSVHQDGMAPMALFALSETSGVDFTPSIYRGLNWIFGRNELNVDFRNTQLAVIWRNIHQPTTRRYCHEALRFLFEERQALMAGNLKILFECHPYHLGWLLYAFAGRQTTQSVGSSESAQSNVITSEKPLQNN